MAGFHTFPLLGFRPPVPRALPRSEADYRCGAWQTPCCRLGAPIDQHCAHQLSTTQHRRVRVFYWSRALHILRHRWIMTRPATWLQVEAPEEQRGVRGCLLFAGYLGEGSLNLTTTDGVLPSAWEIHWGTKDFPLRAEKVSWTYKSTVPHVTTHRDKYRTIPEEAS